MIAAAHLPSQPPISTFSHSLSAGCDFRFAIAVKQPVRISSLPPQAVKKN
jgi:hypothetical protein